MTRTGQPRPGGQEVASLDESTRTLNDRWSALRSKIIMEVAAVAIGVAGAIWAGLSPGTAAAAEVRLEPTSSAGANPFMSPVGQDQSNVTAPANTGGKFSGDTPGLFADTGDKPSCDAQSLVANLQADAAKATAWVDALGIRSEDIPGYVASLTPVVLRSDTSVTSHGYTDGRFLAYPVVLQAGTAVFVNSYGEPKVKCFSGNPLTKAVSYPQASYVGPAWGHFAPTSVTIIHRTPTVINNYTFVDVHKGATVYRPAKPPQHNDDNWYCKKHPDSDKCKGGTIGTGGGTGGTGGGGDNGKHNEADEAPKKAADEAAQRANEAGTAAGSARAVADDKKVLAEVAATDAKRAQDAAAATSTEAATLAGRAREAEESAVLLAAEAAKDRTDGRKAAQAATARLAAEGAKRVADLKAAEADKAAKTAEDAAADTDARAAGRDKNDEADKTGDTGKPSKVINPAPAEPDADGVEKAPLPEDPSRP